MRKRCLTAFKAYDLPGCIGQDMDHDGTYRLGRAAAGQKDAKSFIIGLNVLLSLFSLIFPFQF